MYTKLYCIWWTRSIAYVYSYKCKDDCFLGTVKKRKFLKHYDILYQLDLCDVYHSKWLNCVKDILNKCGFINCWNDQLVPRNFNLSKKVKQYLYDSYVEYWKFQIFNAPKYTNYRMYKSEFGLEKYFTIFHLI
jgi:hypothetical protein